MMKKTNKPITTTEYLVYKLAEAMMNIDPFSKKGQHVTIRKRKRAAIKE